MLEIGTIIECIKELNNKDFLPCDGREYYLKEISEIYGNKLPNYPYHDGIYYYIKIK